jgi:SSS family solute:Na+ symporter
MQTIDWVLVIVPIAVVFGVAVYTNRFVKSVADFLSGGRCAGRYLLANARGESDAGLSNTQAQFEKIIVSGFVLSFWDKLFYPVILLFGIGGFVIYRFRETRAMTLAQFFEIRYSRPFRLYMGILGFVSGVLNYGVFPAISARFLVYYLNLPLHLTIGPVTLSTFGLIMFSYLGGAVLMVVVGGQASTMIADCLEGIFSHLVYIILAIAVLCIVSWSQIVDVMKTAPQGFSGFNPFDASNVSDFNIWFVMMSVFIRIYSTMAMQNKQGFNSAARTAHEARMGGILGEWRGQARALMLLVLCICAAAFIRHSAFNERAAPAKASIAAIDADEVKTPSTFAVGSPEWFKDKSVPQLQKQMATPIALRYLLPTGMAGLFCSIMIMGLFAGDTGHLHSWGSIFVQDVVLPLRKKPMSPRQHIWTLRGAVIGVAAFAFFFSTYFTPTQYINLWWNVTGAIYTGGAGAAIIGGLYWRKGTTSAAWAGVITGSLFAVGSIICTTYWDGIANTLRPAFANAGIHLPDEFWFNQQVGAFLATVFGAAVYIAVSFLTSREPFNLDKMLHRGQYAVEADGGQPTMSLRERFTLRNIFRFDHNFTRLDKVTAGGIFWWSVAMLAVNVIITVWCVFSPWPISWWAHYWMITGVVIPCIIAVVTLFWFGIGGFIDMKAFFRDLRTMTRDARDDGRVVGHRNLEDLPPGPKEIPPSAALSSDAKPVPAATISPQPTGTP